MKPGEMKLSGMKLGEALSACATRFPQRTALIFQEQQLTYGELLGIAASHAVRERFQDH